MITRSKHTMSLEQCLKIAGVQYMSAIVIRIWPHLQSWLHTQPAGQAGLLPFLTSAPVSLAALSPQPLCACAQGFPSAWIILPCLLLPACFSCILQGSEACFLWEKLLTPDCQWGVALHSVQLIAIPNSKPLRHTGLKVFNPTKWGLLGIHRGGSLNVC